MEVFISNDNWIRANFIVIISTFIYFSSPSRKKYHMFFFSFFIYIFAIPNIETDLEQWMLEGFTLLIIMANLWWHLKNWETFRFENRLDSNKIYLKWPCKENRSKNKSVNQVIELWFSSILQVECVYSVVEKSHSMV